MGPKLRELALAEVEAALDGGILIGIASMHCIGCNALCKVRTDGSWRSLCGVGGTNEGAEIRHGIVLLKDGCHNGAAAHVLGELTKEGALAVHGIKGLGFCEGQLGPLHRLDGESVLDDAVNDLAGVSSAGSIRLDHGEGAVCGHGLLM